MKKILLTLCVMALTIALSAPAFAAGSYTGKADFKMRGWYKAEGYSVDNLDFNDDVGDGKSFAFSRFMWWLDTSFDKKMGGTIGFEQDFIWGTTPNFASHNATTDALHTGGSPGQDVAGNIEIKNMYFWALIPGTKIKATAGLASINVDPDNMIFGAAADRWGWRFDIPLGKIGKVRVAWVKSDEASSTVASDDVDIYIVDLDLGLSKAFKLGYYSVYLNSQRNGSITLAGQPIVDGFVWWNGAFIGWTPGTFYLNAHLNLMTGDTEPAGTSIDLSGYAFTFKAGLKWQSGLRVGLRGWYFTGKDSDDATENTTWLESNAFFVPTEIIYQGARFWMSGSTARLPGLAHPGNTNAIGVEGFVPFSKKLNLMPSVYWINYTEDDPAFGNFVGPATKETNIGTEINLLLTWKPYGPNLENNFLVAYVLAGDGSDPSTTKSADDAYHLAYRVLYTF